MTLANGWSQRHDDLARLRVSSVFSLLLILAITGLPDRAFDWNASLGECFAFDTSPGNNWLYDGLPNAVLYLPAGLLLTSFFRRAGLVMLGLLGLAVIIELYQGLLTDRACQVSDVAGNILGAGLGASLASLATRYGMRRLA